MTEAIQGETRAALCKRLQLLYRFPVEADDLVTAGTVVKRSVFPFYTEILFCEDGFVDEAGQPYLMQAWGENGSMPTQRIVAVYKPDGTRHLFPADDGMLKLIGTDAPASVQTLNYGKVKSILHRKTLRLQTEPRQLSERELRKLRSSYAGSYKKGRLLAGGLLLTLCVFLIFAMLFLFLFSSTLSDYPEAVGKAILAAFVFGWLICSALVVILTVRAPMLLLRKPVYRFECLVESVRVAGKTFGSGEVSVILFSGGGWKLCSVRVPYYNVPLLQDMKRFDTVYRYSRHAEPRDSESCLLIKAL